MADTQTVERKLAAIFAADVAGYSQLMQLDETATLRALRSSRAVIDPLIAAHRGRIFNTAGDSVVADFSSAVDAVECAMAVQDAVAAENEHRPGSERMWFRIGVHLGDVVVDGNNLLGDGVNIAARLQALAEPGGICISSAVRDQLGTKLPARFVDLGGQRVKNIDRPLHAFEVYGQRSAAASAPRGRGAGTGRGIRLGIAAIAVALLIAAAAAWWHGWLRPPGAANQAAAVALAPRLSMVVLPFANLSQDPAQDYFADAISEDLTTDLSRIAGALVIAHSSAANYKGKPIAAKQIGSELGVRYVVRGSVQRADTQVRINAALIDARTETQLWAERFDRDIGDLFMVQNEITARIANALQSQLAVAEARRPIEHPDALDYLLRGRAELTRPVSREANDAAARDFEKALALDPKVPDGKAWLANMLAIRVFDEFSDSPDDDLRRAAGLAAEALAAMPNSALAHYARAQVLRAENRCKEAIPEYETAIAIDRSRAAAYAHIGWCKFLTGSVEQVVPYFEQAIRISPSAPGIAPWYGRLGVMYLLNSRIDEAIPALERARNENARLAFVHAYLAAAYALTGQQERAHAALAEAQQLSSAYANLASIEKSAWYADPKIRALAQETYFAGLRKAGLPEG